ncbi:Probable hydrolase YcaC [Geodia barretti]|uniref:Probable hydrolase YcaC n=1 Tax=Geodia barretti TaxID=519541 RepID=A0AA35T3B9_GEOBA|nr:Probable hydrolase YcaC [Geodia barretti]
MTTQIARDPKTDHLLTPENSALILIDFQPGLIDGTRSVSREILVNNVLALAKTGSLFKLPIVLTTVAVSAGYQEDTIAELKSALPGVSTVDRSRVNAWEEPAFREAVIATGRRKLIMAGLWTEVCLVFPPWTCSTKRIIQAGAIPVTWEAVMAELARLNMADYDMSGFMELMNVHLPRSV